MNKVFLVQHAYEIEGMDEIKTIGIYSTEENAKKVVEEYKKLPGFKDYPEGFYIGSYELDKSFWEDGFIHWEDAY